MIDYYQKVLFNDVEYIVVDGALTTPEAFKNGVVSYAHIFSDGKIRRYGEEIGSKNDLIHVGYEEVEVEYDEFFDGIFEGSWGW